MLVMNALPPRTATWAVLFCAHGCTQGADRSYFGVRTTAPTAECLVGSNAWEGGTNVAVHRSSLAVVLVTEDETVSPCVARLVLCMHNNNNQVCACVKNRLVVGRKGRSPHVFVSRPIQR